MQTRKVHLKTLTPIHIGSGAKLNPNFEYLHFKDERKIALVDDKKILTLFGKDDDVVKKWADDWVSIVDKEENLLEEINRRREGNIPAMEVASRTMNIIGQAPTGQLREQFHATKDKVAVIPGSSIKGSMRTAILNHLIEQQPEFVKDEQHLGFRRGNRTIFKDGQINGYYFGGKQHRRTNEWQIDPNKDTLRLLRVFDFPFQCETEVQKCEVINEFRHGWGVKKDETSYVECIPADAESNGSISIPVRLIQAIESKRYPVRNLHLLKANKLTELFNKHTQALIDSELKYWEEENPEVIGDYVEALQNIKNTTESCGENEFVIRVGAGSGWDFMTGGWARKEEYMSDDTWYDLKNSLRRKNYPDAVDFPKTRKLLEGGMPLGFAKLTIEI